MGLKTALLATRILEGMFFCGLAGCAVVVVLSWWSILFKSGFARKD